MNKKKFPLAHALDQSGSGAEKLTEQKPKREAVIIKGEFPKISFYKVLECIDLLKFEGYQFVKHERIDNEHTIFTNYILEK